jgi:hypothetical protein
LLICKKQQLEHRSLSFSSLKISPSFCPQPTTTDLPFRLISCFQVVVVVVVVAVVAVVVLFEMGTLKQK